MKKPITRKAKQDVGRLILHAEVVEIFKSAAKVRGKKSAFLAIRIQETGRAE